MTLTFTEDRETTFEDGYIPVYARRGRKSSSKAKSRPAPVLSAGEDTQIDTVVPAYARARSSSRKPVKTWMILAPVGVLAIGGVAALMLLQGGSEPAAPVAEPAQPISAPAPAAPLEPALTATAAPPVVVTAEPAPPVVREASPAPRAAPVSRAAAQPRAAAAPAVDTAEAETATSALNRAQAAPRPTAPSAPVTTPAPAPRTLQIQTEPLS